MNLDSEQTVSATIIHPDIVVVAGPGSGKTHTLVSRIEYLMSKGANPSGMVVITFTNAAAFELMRRLDKTQLGYIGTLHGFMLRLLNHTQKERGLPAYAVMTEQDARTMLEMAVREAKYEGSWDELEKQVKLGPGEHLAKATTPLQLAAVRYFKRMRHSFLIDFDSILQFGFELIEPGFGKMDGATSRYLDRFDFLFVDEYQDSSKLDDRIYTALPFENKFYVGDPDQAIYGFRGGDVSCIIKKTCDHQHFVTVLQNNYRSSSPICIAATNLIGHNIERVGKVTVSRRDTAAGEPVTVMTLADEKEEASYVARELMQIPPSDWSEVAVLLRTNIEVNRWAQLLAVFSLATRRNVTTNYPADWKRTIRLLNALVCPDNDIAMYMFLKFGTTVDADKARQEAAKAFQSINDHSVKFPRDLPMAELMEFLTALHVSAESCNLVLATTQTLDRHAGIPELIAALLAPEEEQHEEGEGITVTTMHSAKGREWSRVFLPGWNEGFFPKLPKNSGTDKEEEERRLAYVAITRAKDRCTISCTLRRTNQWQQTELAAFPSRFIKEIAF